MENPITQNVAPYLGGAALGAIGQQGMNMVTGGADPNPLISGALYAPAGASWLRGGRMPTNLPEQMAYGASLAGMAGGAGTSVYNTVAGGEDIDNNNISAQLAILGAVAPLTMNLINKARGPKSQPDGYRPPGTRDDDGGFNPFMQVKPHAGNYYDSNTAYPYNQGTVPSPFSTGLF